MISKRKITSDHIHSISEFLEENQRRWVTVKRIMEHLHNKQILPAISTTIVRAVLKHQLNKTYKKVDVVNQTWSTKENVRKFCESAMITKLLDENGFELIYVDEFTLWTRGNKYYTWTDKGVKGFIDMMLDNFSMGFTVAFSKNRIYGILGSTCANNSKTFILFLSSLFDCIENIFKITNGKIWVVLDNASIHVSKEIEEFIKNIWIRLITICPYSQSLNPWEKLISVIKMKMKARRMHGR